MLFHQVSFSIDHLLLLTFVLTATFVSQNASGDLVSTRQVLS